MKKFFLVLLMISMSIIAKDVVNTDKPEKGIWDFNPQEVWRVDSAGKELLVNCSRIRTDKEGNVYMMEHKLGKIFKFNKDGKFITTIGKKGEGPGEFVQAYEFFIINDDVIVSPINSKLVYFDRKGKFKKQVNIGKSFVHPRCFVDKDRFVRVRSVKDGKGRNLEKICIYDMKTKKDIDLIEISPEEVLLSKKGGMAVMIKDPATSAGVVLTLQDKSILFGKSDKYKFENMNLQGKVESSFSIKNRKRKLIPEDAKRKRFENIKLNGGKMQKEMIDQLVKGMPDFATFFYRVTIGNNGLIYVFVSDIRKDKGSEIDIFSPQGKYLYRGGLKIEAGSRIISSIAFRKDYAIMFVEDEEGETSLRKYKLNLPK